MLLIFKIKINKMHRIFKLTGLLKFIPDNFQCEERINVHLRIKLYS